MAENESNDKQEQSLLDLIQNFESVQFRHFEIKEHQFDRKILKLIDNGKRIIRRNSLTVSFFEMVFEGII